MLGPVNIIKAISLVAHHMSKQDEENLLQDLLTKFWVQEEVPSNYIYQYIPDEQQCQEN